MVTVLYLLSLLSAISHALALTESATWVAQQAHQLVWKLQEEGRVMRFGLHDGDTKFPASLNAVFAACNQQSEAEVPRERRTPMRLLWVCGVREACLDHLLIMHKRHLGHVLAGIQPGV